MQKNRLMPLFTPSSGRCGSQARFHLNSEKKSSYRCTRTKVLGHLVVVISLLSVPEKVFADVLLARLQLLLSICRRPQQSGFTASRSTIDSILALRLSLQLHHEFNQPLNVAYIDIKAAFDSVERCALWKALRCTGAPPCLVNLIEHLHRGTTSRVRVAGLLS